MVGDFLYGVDVGLEGPRHRLAPLGVPVGKIRQGLAERSALGAGHFAQPFVGFGGTQWRCANVSLPRKIWRRRPSQTLGCPIPSKAKTA
jgi:hypothetical protein